MQLAGSKVQENANLAGKFYGQARMVKISGSDKLLLADECEPRC